jgi:ketosteroid isomerase-like protein
MVAQTARNRRVTDAEEAPACLIGQYANDVVEPKDGDNVRLTEQLFERWNGGLHEVDPQCVEPEVELHSSLSSADIAPYRGYDGVRRRVADIEERFEAWRMELDHAKQLDDGRVLASGVIRARGRGSDVEVEQPVEWLLTFRDERLVRYETFVDEEADPAGIAQSDR